MVEHLTRLLQGQLALMKAASHVLEESRTRVAAVLAAAPELTDAVQCVVRYVETKRYC